MILDVNTDYFEVHGGYEFAKEFYAESYRFAQKIYGEENIISAVMHADELNLVMSDAFYRPIYHYHLHIVALPVVKKDILWSRRCKDKSLVGTVKETVNQISHSKKWKSPPALNDNGNQILDINGKPSQSVFRASILCRLRRKTLLQCYQQLQTRTSLFLLLVLSQKFRCMLGTLYSRKGY